MVAVAAAVAVEAAATSCVGDNEEGKKLLGDRLERGRAATMSPGIEKRLTTVARIATQLLDFGKERRRFLPDARVLISPPLSVLTLRDSDESGDEGNLTTRTGTRVWKWQGEREWVKREEEGGKRERESDARSVKKFVGASQDSRLISR